MDAETAKPVAYLKPSDVEALSLARRHGDGVTVPVWWAPEGSRPREVYTVPVYVQPPRVTIVRIGRPGKPPEGFRELPGGIHLGRGIWMLRYERIEQEERGGR